MQRTFKLNGVEYKAADIDFNAICDMEDAGVSADEFGKKKLSVVRAYFTLCHGGSADAAGKEIEEAIKKEGFDAINPIVEAMNKAMEESDFFRSLSKNEKKENPKKEQA